LANVVAARHASCSFPGGLNGREQKTHEDTDDGDNHQEFHKGKAANIPSLHVNPSKKGKVKKGNNRARYVAHEPLINIYGNLTRQ
jgi:hypothetical protein